VWNCCKRNTNSSGTVKVKLIGSQLFLALVCVAVIILLVRVVFATRHVQKSLAPSFPTSTKKFQSYKNFYWPLTIVGASSPLTLGVVRGRIACHRCLSCIVNCCAAVHGLATIDTAPVNVRLRTIFRIFDELDKVLVNWNDLAL
jgi:hypothetical protein